MDLPLNSCGSLNELPNLFKVKFSNLSDGYSSRFILVRYVRLAVMIMMMTMMTMMPISYSTQNLLISYWCRSASSAPGKTQGFRFS